LYRPEYLPGLDSQAEAMRLASGVAAAVPFVQVNRPRDIHRMDELLDRLEAHWQSLPVLDPAQEQS
jgi:hypothetical protein